MSSFVPALLVKVTLIFTAGLLLTALMRQASSALRHVVLLAALVCGFTLPVVMSISPRWNVRVLPPPPPPNAVRADATNVVTDDNVAPAIDHQPTPAIERSSNVANAAAPSRALSAPQLLDLAPIAPPLIYILGVVCIIAWLAIGRLRLRKIVREAWPLTSPEWRRILDSVRLEAGVTRDVALFTSSVVSTPLTWGTRTPVILLPEDALDWSDDHRRVVLRHEIAHVARGDSFTQLVAGFVCAIYWFHPLAWFTERRLRAECERACDDRVVSLGTPAADYAAHLLEVARSARAFGAPGFLSVAMARPTQLEGRLLAVLNESRRRVAASRRERIAAVTASALVMLPLAAFRPVERTSPVVIAPAPVASPSPSTVKKIATSATPVINREIKPSGTLVFDAGKKFDSTFTLSAPVRSGGTLYIDLNTGGGITIESWDRPEVRVNGRLGGRDWRDTRVTLEPTNGGATLASDFTGWSNNQSTSHDFDIRLPREFNVRIKSSGGRINISNMNGEFSGNTGGGQINLQSVNGRVHLNTGGGQIHVTDSNLDGDVSTGGGQVQIVRVNGNLKGSSGSGPVIRTGSNSDVNEYRYGSGSGSGYGKGSSVSASASAGASAYATAGNGPIIMSAAGGAISLPEAPNGARVETGGGKITIGSAGGAVYAQTGGGDVQIGPTRGSVTAVTGAGDVSVDFRGAGAVDVSAGVGRVTINAPRDLNANLELVTAYTQKYRGGKTRIISDWPVNVTETKEWDDTMGTPRRYVIVRQQIGNGGPLIKVNTVNGDIVLRKAP